MAKNHIDDMPHISDREMAFDMDVFRVRLGEGGISTVGKA